MAEPMDRRDFLQMTAAGAATLALARFGLSGDEFKAKRPNVVLILADDLGYEALGCYGGKSYKTPCLDDMAKTGIRFEHCYATPLCTPSRVQLMTGRYGFRNYKAWATLDPKEKTLAQMLRAAGYATCISGKWQLGGGEKAPQNAGFDEHCLWQVEGADEKGERYHNAKLVLNGKPYKGIEDKYGPDVQSDFILNFIERNKNRPFFAYYPMCLPHAPFQKTPDSKPGTGTTNNTEFFADMVAYADKLVGKVIAKLDALGLRENTLVIFIGDNGTDRRITSALGDRKVKGEKGRTTDAGTHVPMIVNWKGTTAPGKVCADLVDFSDFMPTLAEICGAKLPEGVTIDGRSFQPQIRGQVGQPREWIFCFYDPKLGNWTRKRYAQDKRWKLYDDGNLFDLRADLPEAAPLVTAKDTAEMAEARRRLQAVLDKMQ